MESKWRLCDVLGAVRRGVGRRFPFSNTFFFHHVTASLFTFLALIKEVINASTYKLNILSYTIPLCPSRTTKTRCLVDSVGTLLPLPFDLAMSTPSHYPTFSLTNNQDSLSGCFGGSIVAPPFRLGDIHLVSVRCPPLVKLPSLPGHGLKAGGLGAVLHTFPSAVAL